MRFARNTLRPVGLGILSIALLAPSGAAAAAGGPGEDDAVKKAHKQWTTGLTKRDAAAVDGVLMDGYTMVDPGGRQNEKKFIVDGLKGGQLKLESVDVAEMTVRVIGSTAIVTSAQTLKGTYDDNEISGRYRVTDVLVKQDGKWKIAAGHMTRMEE